MWISRRFTATATVSATAAVAAVTAALACGARVAAAQPGAAAPDPAAPWPAAVTHRTVLRPRVGPRLADRALGESSALVASARAPGLLWTLNDSGGEPELFAVAAADGRAFGRVRVTGARNVDWEALAPGPCGPAPGGDATNAAASNGTPPGGCLYVGDVGDNGARRAAVTLYRVPEPLGAPAGPPPARGARARPQLPAATAPAAALAVRYPDGPHDVEALAVFPTGDAWLITKRPQRRPDGSLRPALVYEVPAAAWAQAARGPVTARLVDSLPVVPDETITNQVTDAALDAGRRVLAVRTYSAVYLVPVAGPPWRVDRARRATACDVTVLREPQGEGVTFAPGARGPDVMLVLSSERNWLGLGGLSTAGCPAPR